MLPTAASWLGLLFTLSPPSSQAIVLRDVHVVDVERGRIERDRSLVIEGERIVRIGPAQGLDVPAGARVVEGSGRFLLPGLHDMHVHLNEEDGDEYLLLYVANGVTTVQSMHGGPHQLALRERVRSGALLGPRIFTTGPTTARLGVDTVEEARNVARAQEAAGYDALKMYGDGNNSMTRETYHALVAAAHEAGIKVVGHANRNLPFAAVLEEHQDSIDHMEEIVYTEQSFAAVVGPYVDVQFGRRSFDSLAGGARTVPDFAAELAEEARALALRVRAAGLAVTPTVATFGAIQAITDEAYGSLLDKAELRFVPPGRLREWQPERQRFRNGGWKPQLAFMAAYLRRNHELQLALVEAFHDAGVPLMTGTDSPFDFVVQGFSLHDELALFVRAGLTPLDALRAATIVPARFLGIAGDSGSIGEGKRADLVLVEGDPLQDLGALRGVAGVCVAGRWLAGAELEEGLERIARAHAEAAPFIEDIAAALERGKLEEAVEVYSFAEQPPPALARYLEQGIDRLAQRLTQQNLPEAARNALQKNCELFPGSAGAWDRLGDVCARLGKKEEALEAFRRSLELGNEGARAGMERIEGGER
jgi:imidazolonepropionase-like amidohydrolase